MTSKELINSKAAPSAILRQAKKELAIGALTSDEYEKLRKDVLSKEYDEWRAERLVD